MSRFTIKKARRNVKGFTLVELMLAMSLFITVMVVATAGFVGMNRTFTKGVVRKQLSEGVQRTSEELTRALRSGGQLSAGEVEEGSNERSIANSSTCFIWQQTKLYTYSKCSVAEASSRIELLDQRFAVDFLAVENLSGDLYRIKGVFRTADETAFSYEEDDRAAYLESQNLNGIFCKGSAQVGSDQNCALEKLDIVVNAKGEGQ